MRNDGTRGAGRLRCASGDVFRAVAAGRVKKREGEGELKVRRQETGLQPFSPAGTRQAQRERLLPQREDLA
jgi:hypothetical protein